MHQNIVRSVALAILFWWSALAVYGFVSKEEELAYLLKSTVSLVVMTVFGIVIGVFFVWLFIFSEKRVQRVLLEGEVVRGLKSTIGELPILSPEPERAQQLPDLSDLAAFTRVPDIQPKDFYIRWQEKYRKSHPAHAALMTALQLIFEKHKHLPATHIAGGHGGRTLQQHSLLVGYFMDNLGKTWHYKGLQDRSGRVSLKLRDQSYKFNSEDPLSAIIGLAHDIGKIEAFIYDDTSKIVGIHHEHDLTGARMIARLPEAWEIPEEDRNAIILAIAHYHHPMELPLSPDRRAIDDRTIALMELLIKADFATSRVEAGKNPYQQEVEAEVTAKETINTFATEDVWNAFTEIILEHNRINCSDPRFNVGTLCLGNGFGKPMLLVKEDSIRAALIKRMQIPSAPRGDGRHEITISLLNTLDAKGILLRSYQGIEFSAESALWNVDFMTRSATGALPEKKSGWSAVIVIDPKMFKKIEQMDPYWWYAVIQRGTMGAARTINKSKKKTITSQVGSTAVSQGEPEKRAEEILQQAFVREEKTHPLLDTTLWEEEKTPQQIEAPQPQPTEIQAEKSEEHQEKKEEPTTVKQIAPIDIRKGLMKAVIEAESRGMELREINGTNYLISKSSLIKLVQDVDWEAGRFKIEQMARSRKVDCVYVPIGEDGDYALVFDKRLGQAVAETD